MKPSWQENNLVDLEKFCRRLKKAMTKLPDEPKEVDTSREITKSKLLRLYKAGRIKILPVGEAQQKISMTLTTQAIIGIIVAIGAVVAIIIDVPGASILSGLLGIVVGALFVEPTKAIGRAIREPENLE